MSENSMNGFLLVSKPVGLTSFQVVRKVRYLTQVKRVGHAGTLDPFASGLLVLALGRAFTRRISEIQDLKKTYTVTMVVGIETDTLDSYGNITSQVDTVSLPEFDLQDFVGPHDQLPPQHSAKKIGGKRSYDMARAGQFVEHKPASVEIYKIDLLSTHAARYPHIQFRVECSKGTYVRSLVRDIGARLGYPCYAKDLVRDAVGSYINSDAVPYDGLSANTIQEHLFV